MSRTSALRLSFFSIHRSFHALYSLLTQNHFPCLIYAEEKAFEPYFSLVKRKFSLICFYEAIRSEYLISFVTMHIFFLYISGTIYIFSLRDHSAKGKSKVRECASRSLRPIKLMVAEKTSDITHKMDVHTSEVMAGSLVHVYMHSASILCMRVAGRIRHAINDHENRNGLINQRCEAFVFEVMLCKCEMDNL